MMKISTNLSKMAREIHGLRGKLFKAAGDSIAKGVMEEFRQLVEETAQWTGTTAASWNIDMKYRVGPAWQSPVRVVGDKKTPLERGHGHAVGVAMAANAGKLDNIGEDYKQMDIVVANDAPGATRAEEGPLRAVNTPTGAFARFKERVAHREFDPIKDIVL